MGNRWVLAGGKQWAFVGFMHRKQGPQFALALDNAKLTKPPVLSWPYCLLMPHISMGLAGRYCFRMYFVVTIENKY